MTHPPPSHPGAEALPGGAAGGTSRKGRGVSAVLFPAAAAHVHNCTTAHPHACRVVVVRSCKTAGVRYAIANNKGGAGKSVVAEFLGRVL